MSYKSLTCLPHPAYVPIRSIIVNFVEPILLTWINFKLSVDKSLHPFLNVGWKYLSIPQESAVAVEAMEWIDNFIQDFTGHAITYPCRD